MFLDDIKIALRVSHNALDSDISDLIEEARHDLMLSGVSSKKANDDTDPLIKRAIKTYCKAEFTSDARESERFKTSYNMLKNHLTLAGDYK
ncbi:head-tail connector protein [Bacillus paranthracis]|uniref:head-tail connector protein n=1 Tax=Bacillus cereus group TaxID=86661 RepID=UPI001E492726|nr:MULTISPECIES: head-tail connector protein [Bacillus cereus group]MCC2429872.1 head-tail connector protein [Bacillus paranthracis]MCU5390500.1 head-tail connector protein [Bacillus paranthracis]MDA1620155.1 head-tail connector protein [Bacillus cereus group sp. TH204-1LC]